MATLRNTIRMLWSGFWELTHPVSMLAFVIAITLTIVFGILEIIGWALIAPSAWWASWRRKHFNWE